MSSWNRDEPEYEYTPIGRRIMGALLWALGIAGVGALLLLAVPAVATHDQPSPLYLKAASACLDQEVVIRLVQTADDDERQKMYVAATEAGECKNFPNWLRVVAHEVVAELPWAGEGNPTPMVVVELFDTAGLTVYSWFTAEKWSEWIEGTSFKPVGFKI